MKKYQRNNRTPDTKSAIAKAKRLIDKVSTKEEMKIIEDRIATEYKDNFFFEPIKFGDSIYSKII